MPTYDYECQACQHRFEHYQEMSAKKLRKCPECGRPKLNRLVGMGAGVIFKGSGFYETDYKRAAANKGGKAASDGETSASSATSGEAKSSTTPAKDGGKGGAKTGAKSGGTSASKATQAASAS